MLRRSSAASLLLLGSDPASGEAGAKRDEKFSGAQGCFLSVGLALLLEDLGPDLLLEELNWSRMWIAGERGGY